MLHRYSYTVNSMQFCILFIKQQLITILKYKILRYEN